MDAAGGTGATIVAWTAEIGPASLGADDRLDEIFPLPHAMTSPAAAMWSGKFDGKVQLGSITLMPDAGSGTLMLAALDGKPIAGSRKLCLCALNRAENPGMGWDKSRRTVSNQWGHGPAVVLGVKAKITLPGDATWNVEALDPTGTPKSVVAEKAHEFKISPEHKTVWWLLTR